jgi:hypothetical protein
MFAKQLIILATFLATAVAFGADKDAAVSYFSSSEQLIVKLQGSAAKNLKTFIAQHENTADKQDLREKIACNGPVCGFILTRHGQSYPLPHTDSASNERETPRLGSAAIASLNLTPPASPILQTTITGAAARLLFNFLNLSDENAAYDIKVRGMKCTREPVSDTYECQFKVAENGTLST